MLPAGLKVKIENQLSQEVLKASPAPGGTICESRIVFLKDSSTYFLKWLDDTPTGLFKAEAAGLNELRKPKVIRVPEVIAFSDGTKTEPGFILLELLYPREKDQIFERTLATQMAALHKVRANEFGFKADNFIGKLEQSNSTVPTWGEFFFNKRLLPQTKLATKGKLLDASFERDLKNLESYIVLSLNEFDEPPTLVHGDFWSGNVLATDSGPAIVDPAVYYGSREVDLAFSEFFSGFGETFYSVYQKHFPLKTGYQDRKELLNLYNILTHVNIFAGSYIQEAIRTFKQIAVKAAIN